MTFGITKTERMNAKTGIVEQYLHAVFTRKIGGGYASTGNKAGPENI
jgi:hypothetical protein